MARLHRTPLILAAFLFALSAGAQTIIFPPFNPPGVLVQPDGTLQRHVVDQGTELADMRLRLKAATDLRSKEKLAYVSIPRAFTAAQTAVGKSQPIPDDAKYLGGLTRIDYLFVYPDSHDLVIAGPAEPINVVDDIHAFGKRTGRPVARLEDLAVAMRLLRDLRRGGVFGCRIDPDPASPARVQDVMNKYARAPRAQRMAAFQEALGPQRVSFFGGIPDDSRFALAALAADYELKRYGLGLARTMLSDLGTSVDNTRAAVSMIWYELAYDPITTTKENDAFGLRGPRLKIQAGNFDWDPKGATPKAFDFAKRMSQRMELLATMQPLIADLQNLADLSVVAALIRRDRLDQKVGWDGAWAVGEVGGGYPVAKLPVPRTAEALVNYTNGSIAGGGVTLDPSYFVSAPRVPDPTDTLMPVRTRYEQLRADKPDAPALFAP